VNLTDIYHDRTHLQGVRQQLVTSHNSLREGENFLWALVEASLKNYGTQEQKCLQYYQAYKSMEAAYKSMEAKYGDLVTELHSATMANVRLQGDLEKAEGVVETANRRAEELGAFHAKGADMNMSLQQELNWAREKIRDQENRIKGLGLPGVAIGSKDTDVGELGSVIQTPELSRPEGGDNGLDTQDTDSTISLVGKSKLTPLSSGDGGHQNAEETAEHGGQKRSKRGRKGRKLTPANLGLGIS
jgi:chromosome segregation ATPase